MKALHNLVKRVYLCQPMRQPQRPSLTKDEMISEYKDVFTGVGQYEKEYNIELVANAQSVIQLHGKFRMLSSHWRPDRVDRVDKV